MSAVLDTHGHDDHHHHAPSGMMRWISTTNHKDIGTMYLWFSFAMFMVGGVMALVIRAELFQPGLQVVNPEFFNSMTTMHGLIMVFGAIMPAFVGFANWLIPMQIGAPDMAFARMNNWSFWILPFAGSLLIISFFVPGGAPGVGWTMYAATAVKLTQGEPKIYRSSTHGRRHFCAECGTGLFYTNAVTIPDLIDIQSATYDEPDNGSLTAARKQGWVVISMKKDWKLVFSGK